MKANHIKKKGARKMKQLSLSCFKKVFAIMVSFSMLFTLVPTNLITVKAAGNSMPSGYTSDDNGVMAYKEKNKDSYFSYIDIYGKVNGYWLRTTYGDYGYKAYLTGNNAILKAKPSFINDGRYIKLEYIITASADTTVNFSVDADIMIGGDDKAEITKFSDDSGFKMENTHSSGASYGEGAQFNFYGKNVYGVDPNVDTYWFGYYDDRSSNRYNNVTSSTLKNTDSGMACSWKNMKLKSGETKTVSIIIGIGEASNPPIISDVVIPDTPVEPGKEVEITIPIEVPKAEDAAGMKLYYDLIYNETGKSIYSEPQLITDVDYSHIEGTMRNFVAKFTLPENMAAGDYTLKVFAMNKEGAVSAQISKQMSATYAAPVITDITSNKTIAYGTNTKLTCTATGKDLTYQWQKKNGNTFEDITGATSYEYITPKYASIGTTTYRCIVSSNGSDTISPTTNVTTTKASSQTTLTKAEWDSDMLTLSVDVKGNGSSLNTGKVTFYDGSSILGNANVTNGIATLEVSKDKLETKNYSISAKYNGSDIYYSSTSDTKPVYVQLTKTITYEDSVNLISQVTSGLLTSFVEGNKTTLNIPNIIVSGFKLMGFTDTSGNTITEILDDVRGDITLNPIWQSVMFDITQDTNLGDTTVIDTKQANTEVTITAPTKDHYDFKNWTSTGLTLTDAQKNNPNLTFTMPENNVNLIVNYTPKTYTISYANVSDGTTNTNATSYQYGSGVVLKDILSDGKIFNGWYLDQDYKTKVTSIGSEAFGNITVYAKWTDIHTVKVINDITKTESTVEAGEGSEVMIPADELAGYDFTNWEVSGISLSQDALKSSLLTFDMPKSDVTLTAKYKTKSYGITYELNGGTNAEKNPSSYTYGSTITFLNPTRKGYSFNGWYMDKDFTNKVTGITDTSTEDITVYAKWTKDTYLISAIDATVKVENGTPSTSTNAAYGQKITMIPDPKEGYQFTEWTLNGIETSDITDNTFTMPDHAVSIKANYKKQRYGITYKNVTDDEVSNEKLFPTEYIYGYSMTLANPSRKGYSFAGWYIDGALKKPITELASTDTGAKTFYAKWNTNTYTLSVIDGTFDDKSSDDIAYGKEVTITPIEKTGMNFAGWYHGNTKISDTATYTFNMPAENYVIYAKYEPQTYNIKFNEGTGTTEHSTVENFLNSNDTTYTYGSSITLAYPTAKDLTFNGWVDTNGNKVTNITPDMMGDLELTATWVNSTFTINYKGIEGASNEAYLLNGSTIQTSTSGAQIVKLPSPTKTGYDFKGWSLPDGSTDITITDGPILNVPTGWNTNIELTANWEAKSYNIKVDGNTVSTKVGESVSLTTVPEKGYTFKNWTTNQIGVQLDDASSASTSFIFDAALAKIIDEGGTIEITSVYEPATYSISYELGADDVINNNPSSYTYSETENVKLKAPVRYGYDFKDWTFNGTAFDGTINAKTFGDMDLTATWAPSNYTITADDKEVTDIAHVGDAIEITADNKPGHTFTGWSLVSGEATFDDANAMTTKLNLTTAGNVKVKATYAINTYNINYKDGDMDIITDNPTTYTVEDCAIVLKDAVKDGYEFLGWYSDSSFTNKVTQVNTKDVKDITLYAKFEVIKDSVSIKIQGQGNYVVKNNDAVVNADEIINGVYKTNRYAKVEITFTPSEGYKLVKIIVDSEEIFNTDMYRFEQLIGGHTIEFVTEGKPIVIQPEPGSTTHGEDKVDWKEWDGSNQPMETTTHTSGLDFNVPETKDTTTTYQIVEKGQLPIDDKWQEITNGKININVNDGDYVVYIKVTDNKGDSTITQSNVLHIDNTKPVITVPDVIYTDTKISIEDNSGYTIYVNGKKYDGEILFGNKDATYEIYAIDDAGNKSETVTVNAKTLESLVDSVKDLTVDNVSKAETEKINEAIVSLNGLDNPNVSDEQKAWIDEQTKNLQNLLDAVTSVQDKIAKIGKVVAEKEAEIVNKQKLETALADTKALLAKNDQLTEADMRTLAKAQTQLEAKLSVIATLEKVEVVKDITAKNIKSDKKTDIENAISSLEALVNGNDLQANAGINAEKLEEYKAKLSTLKDANTQLDKAMAALKTLTDLEESISNASDLSAVKNAQEALKPYINNLTDDEKADVNRIAEKVNATTDVITKINEKSNMVQEMIGKLDVTTITSNDRETLANIKEALDYIKENQSHATKEQLAKVEEAETKYDKLIERRNEVQGKLNDLEEAMKSVDTMTSNEQIAVVQKLIDTIKEDYMNNLTDVEKKAIDTKQTEIKKAKDAINAIANAKTKIEKLIGEISVKNVKDTNVKDLEELQENIDIIKNNDKHADEDTLTFVKEAIEKHDNMVKQLDDMHEAIADLQKEMQDIENVDSLDKVTEIQNKINDIQTKYKDNMSTDDQKAVTDSQKQLTDTKDIINKVIETTKKIENALADLDVNHVKVNNQTTLEDIAEELKWLDKNASHVDAHTQTTIDQAKAKTEELKKRVEEVQKKLDEIKDITVEEISSATKSEDLDEIKQKVNELINDYKGNLNDNEIAKVEKQANAVEETQAIIQEIKDKIAKVEEAQKELNKDSIKTDDKAIVEEIQKDLDWIKEHEKNVDAADKETIDRAQEKNEELSDRIEEVEKKLNEIKDITIEEISSATKVEDLSDIEKKLDEIINDYKDNLNDDEKKVVEETKATVDTTKEIIKELDKKIDFVEKALEDKDKTNVTENDEKTLEDVAHSLDYIEEHKKNLDKDKIDTYQKNVEKTEEMKKQLDDMRADKKDVDDSKPKEKVNENNIDQYTVYEKKLDNFIDKYENNLTDDQKMSMQKDQLEIAKSIEEVKEAMRRKLVAVVDENTVEITSKGKMEFDSSMRIKVDIVNDKLDNNFMETVKNTFKKEYNGEIHEVYDISILKNNVKITVHDEIEIRIKLTEEQLKYPNIGVIYINDAGEITKVNSHVEEGYIVFTVNHLSKYAVVSYDNKAGSDVIIKDTSSSQTVNTSMLWLVVLCGGMLLKKRKTQK